MNKNMYVVNFKWFSRVFSMTSDMYNAMSPNHGHWCEVGKIFEGTLEECKRFVLDTVFDILIKIDNAIDDDEVLNLSIDSFLHSSNGREMILWIDAPYTDSRFNIYDIKMYTESSWSIVENESD